MKHHEQLEIVADYLETDNPSIMYVTMQLRRMANDLKYAAGLTGRREGSDRRTVNDSARRPAAV